MIYDEMNYIKQFLFLKNKLFSALPRKHAPFLADQKYQSGYGFYEYSNFLLLRNLNSFQ